MGLLGIKLIKPLKKKEEIMKYIVASIVLFLGISYVGHAQMRVQKIGDNPTRLNPSAALEIESASKGVLMPRVALQSLTTASPLTAMVKGMMVYNTTVNADLSEGFYLNNGTEWVLLVTKNNLANSRSGDLDMHGDNILHAGSVNTGELHLYDNNLHEFYGGNDTDALTIINRENNVTKIYDARTLKPLFSISNSTTGANASNDSGAGGRVGINTDAPDLSADLTLSSSNRGLLLNRVALTGSGDKYGQDGW